MLALDMRVQTVLPPEGSCNEEDFCAYRRGPVMLGADARLGKDPEDAFAVRHDVGNIVPDVRLTDCREIPEARVCAELPTTDGEAVPVDRLFLLRKNMGCNLPLRRLAFQRTVSACDYRYEKIRKAKKNAVRPDFRACGVFCGKSLAKSLVRCYNNGN